MLAEKAGVGRQTRVAEATPPRSSRSRRDKPQGLAPFPATGRGEVWGRFFLWRGSVAGWSGLRSGIRELADLSVRVGGELSACERCQKVSSPLRSPTERSADRGRDGAFNSSRDATGLCCHDAPGQQAEASRRSRLTSNLSCSNRRLRVQSPTSPLSGQHRDATA